MGLFKAVMKSLVGARNSTVTVNTAFRKTAPEGMAAQVAKNLPPANWKRVMPDLTKAALGTALNFTVTRHGSTTSAQFARAIAEKATKWLQDVARLTGSRMGNNSLSRDFGHVTDALAKHLQSDEMQKLLADAINQATGTGPEDFISRQALMKNKDQFLGRLYAAVAPALDQLVAQGLRQGSQFEAPAGPPPIAVPAPLPQLDAVRISGSYRLLMHRDA